MQGVEATYDRHSYSDEKAKALRQLAKLVDTILHPLAGDNVVMLADRATAP